MSDTEQAFSLDLETQLNAARALEKDLTTEYAKLQERHADLMKALKSTRDQRIKQIDTENKNGFLLGHQGCWSGATSRSARAAKSSWSSSPASKEYVRLGRPQTYDDGNDDNPILSADTVDLDPETE
jgi:hypothetical protein